MDQSCGSYSKRRIEHFLSSGRIPSNDEFVGSIGSVIAGSGLREIIECCSGSNAVSHILTGKALARAVCSHLLIESALHVKLLNILINPSEDTIASSQDHLSQIEIGELQYLFNNIVTNKCKMYDDGIEFAECLQKLDNALQVHKVDLTQKSRTSKLWLQYIKHVQTLKQFICGERTGNFQLHLHAISEIQNLFAATGHNNYAKSARLYLQMMYELPTKHPWLYKKFMELVTTQFAVLLSIEPVCQLTW